ncbi:hypothetical protein DL96DRAFT_1631324 [Flagelloscypha sp. PMI_526]|nr:hypothetical protein DL96DRAFT_1631324 [Flagelloscypha sp. PMI_526]
MSMQADSGSSGEERPTITAENTGSVWPTTILNLGEQAAHTYENGRPPSSGADSSDSAFENESQEDDYDELESEMEGSGGEKGEPAPDIIKNIFPYVNWDELRTLSQTHSLSFAIDTRKYEHRENTRYWPTVQDADRIREREDLRNDWLKKTKHEKRGVWENTSFTKVEHTVFHCYELVDELTSSLGKPPYDVTFVDGAYLQSVIDKRTGETSEWKKWARGRLVISTFQLSWTQQSWLNECCKSVFGPTPKFTASLAQEKVLKRKAGKIRNNNEFEVSPKKAKYGPPIGRRRGKAAGDRKSVQDSHEH